jgi:hypothetical protein
MKHEDLRATLRAIAAGTTSPSAPRGAPVVTREAVERDQKAFSAWSHFVRSVAREAGEPLSAPSATLTPLP